MQSVDKALNNIEGNGRSMIAAYVLWFFVGTLGVHRFYLGRWLSGLVMLAMSVAGWLLIRTDFWRSGSATMSNEALRAGSMNQLLVTVLLAPNTIAGWVGDALLLGVWLWWLADAVLTYGMVRKRNGQGLIPASLIEPSPPAGHA